MDQDVITECKKRSLEGGISFPEVVGALLAAGVERYVIDLAADQSRYYGMAGTVYDAPLGYSVPVSALFDAARVKAAIGDIQQGKITYRTFLDRIAGAGCSHYEAYLTGRKVIYLGRDGNAHTEHFPPAP